MMAHRARDSAGGTPALPGRKRRPHKPLTGEGLCVPAPMFGLNARAPKLRDADYPIPHLPLRGLDLDLAAFGLAH